MTHGPATPTVDRGDSARTLLLGAVRFRRGLRRFLADAISPEDSRATIRRRLARRDEAFLEMLARAVYGHPRSPYLALLRAAGCELGDVRALVAREGLERALERLRLAGVHVQLDELKGKAPAIRGGAAFRFRPGDFDNPLVRPHFTASSGGSRGAPTRTLIELDYLADRTPLWSVWLAEHGVLDAPLVFVTPYHAGSVNLQLVCARAGQRFVRWFATARGGSLRSRLAARYVNGLTARIGGFPGPELVGASGLEPAARYLAGLVAAGRPPCVNTAPSMALRLVRALPEARALAGVTFLLGYEPLTAARRRAIERAGARAVATYGFAEGGTVGQQCRVPAEPDDVHVARDTFAVVPDGAVRAEPAGGAPLLLTSLLPSAPKILLNASIGDTATLVTRDCGCGFDQLGYRQHLHTIRSGQKATGEGVTFLGADLARVLEDALPPRFGGAPTDYQLLEEDGPDGLTRYRLLVSPAVGALDEPEVARAFLAELARLRPAYRFMVDQWARVGALTVARQQPLLSARGKLLAFRSRGAG